MKKFIKSKEEVRDLKNKRSDRYQALMFRLKSFVDLTKTYEDSELSSLSDKILKDVKSKTMKETIGTVDGAIKTTNFLYSLNIDNVDEYKETLEENLRNVYETTIEKELGRLRKNMLKSYINDNIEEIPENNRQKYYDAIKYLLHLSKINHIRDMENDIHELKKDLISCVNYNSKIKQLTA